MSHHGAPLFFATLGIASLVAGVAVGAQPYKAPRTSWGDPAIQGVYTNNTNVPYERPVELGTKDIYTAEEYEERRNARAVVELTTAVTDVHYQTSDFGLDPEQSEMVTNPRTSVLSQPANGRMPPLRADAKQRSDAARAAQLAHAYDSAQARPLQERCLIWSHEGPPFRPVGYNTLVQIAQSRGYVVLMTEMVHDARVIPIAKAPPDFGGLKRWQGNSWGHWEADTLVIETTGFSDKVNPRGSNVPMGPEGKVIEKITPTGPLSVRYAFTVSDPSLWDASWGGEFPMETVDGPVFEYACHEGNYGLPNTLRGVREEEGSRSSKP